jgi:hypothetical protein
MFEVRWSIRSPPGLLDDIMVDSVAATIDKVTAYGVLHLKGATNATATRAPSTMGGVQHSYEVLTWPEQQPDGAGAS